MREGVFMSVYEMRGDGREDREREMVIVMVCVCVCVEESG